MRRASTISLSSLLPLVLVTASGVACKARRDQSESKAIAVAGESNFIIHADRVVTLDEKDAIPSLAFPGKKLYDLPVGVNLALYECPKDMDLEACSQARATEVNSAYVDQASAGEWGVLPPEVLGPKVRPLETAVKAICNWRDEDGAMTLEQLAKLRVIQADLQKPQNSQANNSNSLKIATAVINRLEACLIWGKNLVVWENSMASLSRDTNLDGVTALAKAFNSDAALINGVAAPLQTDLDRAIAGLAPTEVEAAIKSNLDFYHIDQYESCRKSLSGHAWTYTMGRYFCSLPRRNPANRDCLSILSTHLYEKTGSKIGIIKEAYEKCATRQGWNGMNMSEVKEKQDAIFQAVMIARKF